MVQKFECDKCKKTSNGHPFLLYHNVESRVFAKVCYKCVQEKEVTVKTFYSVTQIPVTPESTEYFNRLFPPGDGNEVLGYLLDFDQCKICGKQLVKKNDAINHVSRVHGDGIGMFHCFICSEVLAGNWMLPLHKCHVKCRHCYYIFRKSDKHFSEEKHPMSLCPISDCIYCAESFEDMMKHLNTTHFWQKIPRSGKGIGSKMLDRLKCAD